MIRFRSIVVSLGVLAAACANAPDAPEQEAAKPAACATEGALHDLGAMRDAAKKVMVYPLGGGVSVDSVYEALRGQAAAAQTKTEHLRVLEAFVYALGDHHAHLSTNDKLSPRLVPSGASVWVEGRGGKLVVTEVRPGSAARQQGLREGMVIEQINGVVVTDALKPPPAVVEKAEAMLGFAGRVALAGTRERPAKVTARVADGSVLEVEILPAPKSDGPLATLSYPAADVAMIRLNNSIGNTDLNPVFDDLMKQARGAKALILDLRDTPSGGDSVVAKPLMAWFVDGVRGYQKHERGGKSWVEQVEGRKDRFTGKLIVLADRWTGSMGEGTTIGLRAAAGAIWIGTPMAGLRGAIESFDVPCYGVSIRLPVERLYEVSGGPRELATPDVLISEQELAAATGDVMLERALKLVR